MDLSRAISASGRFEASRVYPGIKNVHSLWDTVSSLCADHMALEDPQYGVTMTYKEVTQHLTILVADHRLQNGFGISGQAVMCFPLCRWLGNLTCLPAKCKH